jgi:chromosome segregation ATPase
MKKEELIALGVDQEVAGKVLDAWHEALKPIKDKAESVDGLQKQISDLTEDIKKKEGDIKKLSNNTGNAEELQKTIEEMKEANEKAAAERENKIKELEAQSDNLAFDGLLDKTLAKYKPKNEKAAKAVRALLDVDKLKESKNRESDIDGAVKALVEDEESSIFFGETVVDKGSFPPGVGGGSKGGGDDAAARAVMGLPPNKE